MGNRTRHQILKSLMLTVEFGHRTNKRLKALGQNDTCKLTNGEVRMLIRGQVALADAIRMLEQRREVKADG